jgi:transposase
MEVNVLKTERSGTRPKVAHGRRPAERATKKFHVTLTPEERGELGRLIGSGKAAAQTLAHARILLKADEAEGGPGWGDAQIAEALDVGLSTVARVRQRFVEQGFEAALVRKPTRRTYERCLDGAAEARLITLACSQPPHGRKRWTLALLADRMVAMGHAEHLCYETVRRTLKKTRSSPT